MPDPGPPPTPRPTWNSPGCLAGAGFALAVLMGLGVALAWPYLPKPAPGPGPAPAPAGPQTIQVTLPETVRVAIEGFGPSAGPPHPTPQGDTDPEVVSATSGYFEMFARNYEGLAADVASGKTLASQLPVYAAQHDQQKRYLTAVINARAAAGVSLEAIARSVRKARGKAD